LSPRADLDDRCVADARPCMNRGLLTYILMYGLAYFSEVDSHDGCRLRAIRLNGLRLTPTIQKVDGIVDLSSYSRALLSSCSPCLISFQVVDLLMPTISAISATEKSSK